MTLRTKRDTSQSKQPFIATVLLYLSICTLTLLGSACATMIGHVNLAYTPQSAAPQVADAPEVRIRVDVTDKRASFVVGRKMNGRGIEMAPIVAGNNVTQVLKEAIEIELKNRGFATGAGSAVVLVELSSLKNTFQGGFLSGSYVTPQLHESSSTAAIAHLAMDVMVAGADGKVIFTKWIMAKGANPGVLLTSATNPQVALDAALQNAIAELFSDQDFLKALLTAGRVHMSGG
jgi:uncharacterized lipoprotein YajG